MQAIRRSIAATALLMLIVALYHNFKPMPEGLNYEGQQHSISAGDISFFGDLTYTDANDSRLSDQQIFDELFRMIDASEFYIY